MIPLKIKTKYFTLEVYRRGIVFTIASLLIASGVNLVNGNIFLAIISIFNKQVFKEDSNEYGFSVGISAGDRRLSIVRAVNASRRATLLRV